MNLHRLAAALALAFAACSSSSEPQGLRLSDPGSGAVVKFDVAKKPLPEIPLPNDFATRYDPSSPTGRRVNASLVADTTWEKAVRRDLDGLDGWGTIGSISVGFQKPLDVEVIYARHQKDGYDFSDDAVYVYDITKDSPDYCKPVALDLGNGNFPMTLEKTDYYPNDPRNWTNTLMFEEAEEDLNGNGVLDPGEDTDMDGVLDHPNMRHRDGKYPDDFMDFYERETNTLLMRPVVPLRENTTYAVVLTRRLLDEDGRPVRSPFKWINDTAQTTALAPLSDCLRAQRLTLDDVAFTWSFTTMSITRDMMAMRDGLYGRGPMSWLHDDFPEELSDLYDLRVPDPARGPNLKIVTSQQFMQYGKLIIPLAAGGLSQATRDAVAESHKFIDFHVVGSFISPQFFPRFDTNGEFLPLYEQIWRIDPLSGDSFGDAKRVAGENRWVRPEKVVFWLTVPKKEYAKRPAPVAILGHGYTGNKLDPIIFGGFFARYGMVAMGMECPSHGIPADEDIYNIAIGLAEGVGVTPMVQALFTDRAMDQNGDAVKDSGADYWTAYVFHTRDMIRQSAVDYMRAIQVLKSFDGRTWNANEVKASGLDPKAIAGDFDGDGEIDVGAESPFLFVGGSLGGIMGAVIGGMEPKIEAVVPVSGGGALIDVGVRSRQGGVVQAVNLRMLGPLLVAQAKDAETLKVQEILPDLNDDVTLDLGTVPVATLAEGDTVVLKNFGQDPEATTPRDYRCARVQAGGLFRAAIPSDAGDRLSLAAYDGPLDPEERTGCKLTGDKSPKWIFEELAQTVKYQAKDYPAGTALIAFGDGFGLRRASPEFRRFAQIAQMVLDPSDPANWARFMEKDLLRYSNGEEVRTRALIVNTVGDMSVPMSTGATLARAAGFIDFTNKDPRYGKTADQVLIDTGALDATERIPRYVNSVGKSVLMDVEHLSLAVGGHDQWDADQVPRLDPPLHLVFPSRRLGGYSGTLMPMYNSTGKHAIEFPDSTQQFDSGTFTLNVFGRYLSTRGVDFNLDPCNVDSSCSWLKPVPP